MNRNLQSIRIQRIASKLIKSAASAAQLLDEIINASYKYHMDMSEDIEEFLQEFLSQGKVEGAGKSEYDDALDFVQRLKKVATRAEEDDLVATLNTVESNLSKR